MVLRTGQVTDEYNRPVPGATVYVFDNASGAQATLTSDGVSALAQPVTTDEFGVYSYHAPDNYYREDTWYGGKMRFREIIALGTGGSPGGDLTLRSDLNLNTGANLIKTAAGTTAQTEFDKIGTKNHGVLPSGGVSLTPFVINKTVSGASDALGDWRSKVEVANFTGGYGAAQINRQNSQTNINHTAGTVASVVDEQGYIAIGVPSTPSTVGPVSNAQWKQGHISHTGNNALAFGAVFSALGLDANVGTGPIDRFYQHYSGDIAAGSGARLQTEAGGFYQANCTAIGGSGILFAFGSAMSGGANRKNIYITGGADSNLAGKLGIGKLGTLGDTLEIGGFAKLNRNGTPRTVGSRHEITSDNNDYVVDVVSSHASAPRGMRLRFDAGSPNNTTQDFLTCEDATTQRLRVWSNGNVVNANNSYGAISDKKLKKNIRNAGPQLADIMAIKLRKYRLKSEGKHAKDMLGVIAQEIEQVSPGLVAESPDFEIVRVPVLARGGVGEPDVPLIGQYEEKTQPLGTSTKSVNYSILYMKAVGALQELAAIVEKQGKEIAALKAAK